MGQCNECIQWLIMSNPIAQMVSEIKKTQLSRSLPQRNNTRWIILECKDGSCYFNTQKVEFTYPPQRKKNYDRVETRKKLALYENIKFYDYIP